MPEKRALAGGMRLPERLLDVVEFEGLESPRKRASFDRGSHRASREIEISLGSPCVHGSPDAPWQLGGLDASLPRSPNGTIQVEDPLEEARASTERARAAAGPPPAGAPPAAEAPPVRRMSTGTDQRAPDPLARARKAARASELRRPFAPEAQQRARAVGAPGRRLQRPPGPRAEQVRRHGPVPPRTKSKGRTESVILLPGTTVDDTDFDDWKILDPSHIISRSPVPPSRELGPNPVSPSAELWDPAASGAEALGAPGAGEPAPPADAPAAPGAPPADAPGGAEWDAQASPNLNVIAPDVARRSAPVGAPKSRAQRWPRQSRRPLSWARMTTRTAASPARLRSSARISDGSSARMTGGPSRTNIARPVDRACAEFKY
ncbi:glycosyl hydrolase family 16 protein [Aureococcus anophagefferens]|uniref:Glycosyl hydrolase family 16 protein n=1 Tax=Aureococcus anophagefferens TaxID=44056 RepID=A0ABR1G2Y7_AURAN